jgi:hypothetical protein
MGHRAGADGHPGVTAATVNLPTRHADSASPDSQSALAKPPRTCQAPWDKGSPRAPVGAKGDVHRSVVA